MERQFSVSQHDGGDRVMSITRERLIQVSERIWARELKQTEHIAAVERHLATIGMRAMFGSEASQAEIDATVLEAQFQGITLKSEDDYYRMLEERDRLMEHYRAWEKRVYRIQQQHHISGVDWINENVLGVDFLQIDLWSYDLPFIESDLDQLRELRPLLTSQFVRMLKENGIKQCVKTLITEPKPGQFIHQYVDSVVSVDEIAAASQFFDWSGVFEMDGFPEISLGNGLDTLSVQVGNVNYRGIR